MNKIGNIIAILISGILVAVGIFMIVSGINNKDKGIEVNAVIDYVEKNITRRSDGEYSEDYKVFINYEYNGKKYESIEYNYYESSMKEGDNVSIRINENNPKEIYYSSENIKIGCLIIGLVVLVWGVLLIQAKVSKNKRYEDDCIGIDIEKEINISDIKDKLFRS